MSNINNNAFTKEQLLACLKNDGVKLNADIISKARNHDGNALNQIGYQYLTQLKDHSKTLAWCQISANQNYPAAYTNIGILYRQGFGVCKDYSTAMEYYLRAARDNHKLAMVNVAMSFLNGEGVSPDKYRALEWFNKSGVKPEEIEKLNKEGVYLREEDKNKTIYQLINETEDIQREERKKMESSYKEEIRKLQDETQQNQKQIERENSNEREMLKQSNTSMEQRLVDKDKVIQSLERENGVYQVLVQSKNNEIDLLRKDNQRYERMEQEYQELKRKLEEYQRHSQQPTPFIDNNSLSNENGGNNTAVTTTTTTPATEFDNQAAHNVALGNNVDGITVKAEPGFEENRVKSCLNGNKKRKVSTDGRVG